MRTMALATLAIAFATAAACVFNAHPPSGVQACSDDNPPRCPDNYTCVAGYCYAGGQLPGTGGSGGGDAPADLPPGTDACTPAQIPCGNGAGKRCGNVPNACGGTTACGKCISGESCQAGNVCAVDCGQLGQPCCNGSKCAATDAVCSNGTCTSCGGPNQLCCASDTCTALGAACATTSSMDAGTACLLACATTTGACVTGTDQDCTVTCGPLKIGSKTCGCVSDAWKCPACSFAAGADYSCYKLPTTVSACDASGPVTADAICSAPTCSACGSAAGKAFIDTAGTTRAGYCVCSNNRWNCALTRDWPCPGSPGC